MPAFTHDWGHVSEPVPGGRRLPLPRARVLGGCSSTNATAALRGAPADYDGWAAAGNPGWGWQDVRPYFLKLERDCDFGGDWHGSSGPLRIARGRAQRDFLNSCAAAGHEVVGDLNAPGTIGAGPLPKTASVAYARAPLWPTSNRRGSDATSS